MQRLLQTHLSGKERVKHGEGAEAHDSESQPNHRLRQSTAFVFSKNSLIRINFVNHEKKRHSGDTVNHCSKHECLNRIDTDEIHHQTNECRHDDDAIKAVRLFELAIEPLPPTKRLRHSIRRRTCEDRHSEEPEP